VISPCGRRTRRLALSVSGKGWQPAGDRRNKVTAKRVALKLWAASGEPGPERPPETVAEARAQPGQPAITVLAFTNIMGDIDQEYLSDGVAEDIATQLSHSSALFVATCKATFRYKGQTTGVKEIGRELGVRHVLQGSVRRDGVLMRISAELVEAENGNTVWTKRFERVMADLLDVQDEIADAVAVAIEPAISPAERRLISSKPIVSYRSM
jgi:adenylate cyclase